jgi:hypothetical protein
MPGKHAPASPRSFYLSAGKALGAALGAVGLMVAAVLVLLSRGGTEPTTGSPAIQSNRPVASSKNPTPKPTTTTPSPTPTPSVLPANQITVEVLNGTSRSGLARSTGKKISDAGYRLMRVGNSTTRFAKSTIFYQSGRRGEALAFQKDFPDFTVLRQSSATGGAILRVVIGSDYP